MRRRRWRRAQQRLGGGGEAGGGEAGVARWQRGGGEGGNETETRDERDRETREPNTVVFKRARGKILFLGIPLAFPCRVL